jgi:hypothetical protein
LLKNHSKISPPRTPKGSLRLCSIPALKPSSETPNPATRTFVIMCSSLFEGLSCRLNWSYPTQRLLVCSAFAPALLALLHHVEHCLLLLLGHFWQFPRLDVSQTNVVHHASSPGGGRRRKLACSIGSPYSRQALGKSTAEPIFIFNSRFVVKTGLELC